MRHVLHFVGINSEPTRKVDAGMAAEYDQVHRCACQPGRIEGTTTARALKPSGQRRPHGRLHLSSCWLEGQSVTGTFLDFDGDGRAEIPISSQWGIGLMEHAVGALSRHAAQRHQLRWLAGLWLWL